MKYDDLTNLLVYGMVWLLKIALMALVVGMTAGTVPGFGADGALLPYRAEITVAVMFMGSGITTWLDATRPKVGAPAPVPAVTLSDDDIQRIAAEQARQRRERVNLVRTAGKVRRD